MTGQVHIERERDVAVLVIDNPPVNAGSTDVRRALMAAIATVTADADVKGAVLIGAGRSFIAGSDIREFDLPLAPPEMPQVIAAIEAAAIPFVAALHGAALGGGYELALGCDWRLAAPGTVVGLPETTLGIIPGAGGTQKLPRLVGRPRAIDLIATGARVGADEALGLGMIDAIATGDLRQDAVALAARVAGQKRRVIDMAVPDAPGLDEAIARASRRARPHVIHAIDCVRMAGSVAAADGLAQERALFQTLRIAPEARALRHIFFAERDAARGHPDRAARPLPVDRFGVIGSGTMGAGIATAILLAGKPVVLIDSDAAALDRGLAAITAALEEALRRGKIDAAKAQAARANLTTSLDLAALSACDLVIEAVFEDLDIKRDLVARLDAILRPDAILATNTSYLDIDAMAAATSHPDRVIGMHFFSPAHIMKLLEIVRAGQSSDLAMATGFGVARMLGKQPVEAGNSFGFIGNRIYAAYRAACEFMLEDGALPQDIDAALQEFGFAMGPFAVADLSGLDIAWRMRRARAHLRDPADRYVDIPDRLCEAGRFGRKTGAGYYRYEDGKPRPDPEVEAMILAASRDRGIARAPLAKGDIPWRAMAAIVNEAAHVLSEGVAIRPGDIDVVLVNGYGFPRWTGGPVHWARQQDVAALTMACARAARMTGPGHVPADLKVLGITGDHRS